MDQMLAGSPQLLSPRGRPSAYESWLCTRFELGDAGRVRPVSLEVLAPKLLM
jgi:hypothetical protein